MGPGRNTCGILNPYRGFHRSTLDRQAPAPDLAAWVEHYWTVHWELPPGERFEREVLPHPSVQLAFEARASAVHGVGTRRLVAQLEGSGRALGVKLEPGAFPAFSGLPVAELVDRALPIVEVFGESGSELAARVLGEPNTLDAIAGIEHFLRQLAPRVDANIEIVSGLVEYVRRARGVTRSDELARHAGVSLRSALHPRPTRAVVRPPPGSAKSPRVERRSRPRAPHVAHREASAAPTCVSNRCEKRRAPRPLRQPVFS